MLKTQPHGGDTNSLTLPELYAAFAATGLLTRLYELARDEDLGVDVGREHGGRDWRMGSGDVTSDCCIDPARTAVAKVVARAAGRISGLATIPDLLPLFAPSVRATFHVQDGADAPAMQVLATLQGPLDEILGLERTLLNIVGRLSGVATRTTKFVSLVPAGSRAKVYDTRKTTPGLRLLEKYAVRCGGGCNHRVGLYDAALLKDNHLAGTDISGLATYVAEAAAKARIGHNVKFVQVEVDTIEQLQALLTLPPGTLDIVLLDNMGPT